MLYLIFLTSGPVLGPKILGEEITTHGETEGSAGPGRRYVWQRLRRATRHEVARPMEGKRRPAVVVRLPVGARGARRAEEDPGAPPARRAGRRAIHAQADR